jgi:hypothetical protein
VKNEYSLFDEVKARLSIIEVAEFYGFGVDGGGFIPCPSHGEKTASMKLYDKSGTDEYDYFHCFGCGKHGDVIDLIGIYFNLESFQAARKLADDFNIRGNGRKPSIQGRIKRHNADMPEHRAAKLLIDYCNYINKCGKDYAPKSPDDELHPLYIKFIKEKSVMDYYADYFIYGSKSERRAFLESHGDVIARIERELNNIPKQKTEREYSGDR